MPSPRAPSRSAGGQCRRAAAALLVFGTAAAQEPPAARLEPLTVTAQKVPQDERAVPLSIAVIDDERLAGARIATLDDVSRYAANAFINKNQLYVRGIGTANTLGFDPSIGVFVDGVYLGRASAATLPLWDLAQVEVVRGPQGTLLGKNTVGGAVALTTLDPGARADGSVELAAGEVAPHGYRAGFSLPWGEDWALRLALLDERAAGYVRNTTRHSDDLARRSDGLRAKLAWRPPGAFSASLALDRSHAGLTGFAQQLAAVTDESLAYYRRYDAATEAEVRDYRAASDRAGTGGARDGRGAILRLDWDFGAVRLTSLTDRSRSRFGYVLDVDYSAAPLIALDIGEDYAQWSQELRASGRSGALEYLLGAYGFRSELGVDSVIAALPEGSGALAGGQQGVPAQLAEFFALLAEGGAPDPLPDESRKDFRQRAQSAALFAQATWAFAPAWSLTGGLRWTREDKRLRMVQSFQRSGLVFMQFLGEEAYDARRRRKERDFSPRLALQYDWSPATTLHLLAARGFKGGGFNDFAPRAQVLEFEEERAQTLEAGVKSLLLDGRLGLNATLFDTRLKDLQAVTWDGSLFYVTNAAAVRTRGAELEARWRIGRGWSLRASLGWLHGVYTSFPDAPARADQGAKSQDLSGERLAGAPARSGALGLEYVSAAFGPGLHWRAGVDWLYRGAMSLNLDNDPIDSQPAHALWNASWSLGSAAGRWALRLNGFNLTDTLSRNTAADVPLFAGDHWAEVDPPRRYALALELRW